MKKQLSILILASAMTSIWAGPLDDSRYQVSINKPETSSIQDFSVKVDSLNAGSTILFSVDGESGGRVSVRFNSSGRFWRIVNLKETSTGLYTGQYVVRPADQLQGKTFTLNFVEGNKTYTALYAPTSTYVQNRNNGNNGNGNNGNNGNHTGNSQARVMGEGEYVKPQYKNPDFGTVASVNLREVSQDQLNLPGAAIGAVVGGLLGNQVGGGNGKKATTVIGALGGGYAGNEVGKNMTKQKIWDVRVNFEDGQTRVFEFNQDPQLYSGSLVRREGDSIGRR